MKFSLSTNWCNRRIEAGEEIADIAGDLGFDSLELGFHTTLQQVSGFKSRLDVMPVTSIHAFCPVPLSAPQGYPELYRLASFDEAARALARVHVRKNILFAAEMGATAVVLHSGQISSRGFFRRLDFKRRIKRGRKMIDVFKKELENILPDLEKNNITLGLENLPYLEGFPAEWEIADVCGEFVKPWLDTGHDHVRSVNGWKDIQGISLEGLEKSLQPVGLHINDSIGGDDHLPPGEGQVDFGKLKDIAANAKHLVFEPRDDVSFVRLLAGLRYVKAAWLS